MGTYATPPDWEEGDEDRDDTTAKLGELLSGRFADVDVDSVAVVREHRERR